jgi:hypothetical protein
MWRAIQLSLVRVFTLASFLLLFSLRFVSSPVMTKTAISNASFFANAWIEEGTSYKTFSDGDLWPSCWSDDDNLYAANGDGRGFNFFSVTYYDIVVNRISGTFPNLSGQALAWGDAVGQVWNSSSLYNRKPTSMLCIDGALYLAVQDLSLDFNDAPTASISKSTDHGLTWTWDATPMFDKYQFTTLMFLDYGKDSANAIDSYVYVYGLDYNWRESNNHRVPDPLDLYLARVPRTSVLTRSTWTFYGGLDSANTTVWSADMSARVPVLHFDRAAYLASSPLHFDHLPALTQGGIVYDKPLNRYIYSAWTQYTFEFYEAPQPWGPWTHFLTQNFGKYPWTYERHGGYGTTIPSKFISEDGRQMWVQSNVCPCGDAGTTDYQFGLRRLYLEPIDAPSSEVAAKPV